MPPSKKRKTTRSGAAQTAPEPTVETEATETTATVEEPAVEQPTEKEPSLPPSNPEPSASTSTSAPAPAPEPEPEAAPAATAQDRLARFRALQARAKASSHQNLQEATKESQRLATDPSQLTALNRKHAIASHKLLKADTEDAGEDFERKRAWDWTIEESERWDKRTRKREAHRDDTAFKDYGRESEKAYKRQLRNMGNPDLERYTREKMAAIEKAAAAGTLDIVETEDGEMIAVDRDGSFFSTAESTAAFAQHKPEKAAVDRLVADLRKAEEASLRRRKERMAKNGEDGGDVTYINEKNKQFNQKLARFYNKYTAEIRESFERGTMV
ncbi:SYF2 splicing factor-domain-containing protein [Chaetomium sp. MPI-SDFR-AT-0129]|nr:SYF2 splicing factor-domain-containing protein [Chaetomium sp. MPI-SDFR-AT-0129]